MNKSHIMRIDFVYLTDMVAIYDNRDMTESEAQNIVKSYYPDAEQDKRIAIMKRDTFETVFRSLNTDKTTIS